ncbi:hypothetical protein [Nonomuraea maritima]|uniref:hypothetical protein n=1 Tax=Nonomuraea maritima TaxID=683260 RepID=UPI003716C16F
MLRNVGRYRFGRVAALVVGVYLVAMVGAGVFAAVTRDLSVLAAGALTYVPSGEEDGWLWLLLAAKCGFNAWVLWQVLRGPALPLAEGLPRDVVWLRRLLYVGVAGDLVLWELVEAVVSGVYDEALGDAVWVVTVVLLVRVFSGVSAWLRVSVLVLVLGGVPASWALILSGAGTPVLLALPGVASMGGLVLLIIGQRRDGRWSETTITCGRVVMVGPLAVPLLATVAGYVSFAGAPLAVGAIGLVHTVWLARTAHELGTSAPQPAAAQPAAARGSRLPLAVALALPLAAVGAEEGARYSFTGTDVGCGDQVRPYADTRPVDRRQAYLCLARTGVFDRPVFGEDEPDQHVLAYGDRLCAGDDREGVLTPAGLDALEFLCPDVVARQRVEVAREQEERERERSEWEAEVAAMSDRCADPWPRLRGRRQGTAAYLLFEGGGYGVYDDRDDTAESLGDLLVTVEDGIVDAAGSAAVVLTHTDRPMCLTVKAFRSAPPLRLKGWRDVVEVGVRSRSGRLVVPPYPEGGDSGAVEPLPNLAVAGPGPYRMRVYSRLRPRHPDMSAEEHLIVVYPGRSMKKVVHRG